MNETIDLNLLTSFAMVAETRSFTRAAERLRTPRATVSRRVASLERELGVRLFQRTTRAVSLSTAGVSLYERVAGPLSTIADAVQGLPELERAPAGKLRITAPVDLATALLPPILSQYLDDNPNVSAEVSVSNRFVDLVDGGYDCALRVSPRKLRDSSLVGRRVGELMSLLCASPTYLASKPRIRRVSDLSKLEWVVIPTLLPLRLFSGSRTQKVEMGGRIETGDMLFAHQAVLHGNGIGVLPRFLASQEIESGALVHILPRWQSSSGHLWMLWPGGHHAPSKTRAFFEAVSSALER